MPIIKYWWAAKTDSIFKKASIRLMACYLICIMVIYDGLLCTSFLIICITLSILDSSFSYNIHLSILLQLLWYIVFRSIYYIKFHVSNIHEDIMTYNLFGFIKCSYKAIMAYISTIMRLYMLRRQYERKSLKFYKKWVNL